jgi:hypothetical protein
MSTLDEGDADKQLQQAVPWVSDPNNQDQRDEQTRRLQEDVIAAARRLEQESGTLPSLRLADSGTAVSFRIATARVPKEETAEAKAQRVWAELKPEFISPQQGVSRLTLAAGIFGAVALSAMAAFVVVNVVHHPVTIADIASEERAAKGDSRAATTLGDLAKFSEAQAKMSHIDEPVVPSETLLATAPPNDIAAPTTVAAAPPQAPAVAPSPPAKLELAKLEPAKPEIAAAVASAAPTTASATPEPRPASPPPPSASALSSDEAASLLKRGQDLLAAGDVASARLMLTLVAEAGNAEACFILAGTFDPTILVNLRVIGVQGEPAKARAWYARAAELGSQEAKGRLQALR